MRRRGTMASSVPAEESKMTGLSVVAVQPGRKTERCSQRAKSTIASVTILPQGCLRSTFGGRRKDSGFRPSYRRFWIL